MQAAIWSDRSIGAAWESPPFRPTLRWYHARFSLLGWLGALGVMLAIDLVSGLLAAAVVMAIYQYLKRGATAARWADGQRSYHLQIVREHLLAANARIEHSRTGAHRSWLSPTTARAAPGC